MTVSEMIAKLQKLQDKHGDIMVFFDCPYCEKSHTPNRVITESIHLTADLKPELGGKK